RALLPHPRCGRRRSGRAPVAAPRLRRHRTGGADRRRHGRPGGAGPAMGRSAGRAPAPARHRAGRQGGPPPGPVAGAGGRGPGGPPCRRRLRRRPPRRSRGPPGGSPGGCPHPLPAASRRRPRRPRPPRRLLRRSRRSGSRCMSLAGRLESLTPEQRRLFELLRKQRERTSRASQAPPVTRVSGPDGAGDWPLTFDQERLWFLHQLAPESSTYNMPTATRLRGLLDVAALAESIRRVVRRHGAWRTSFPAVDGRPVQRVSPEPAFELPVVDLGALPAAPRDAAAQGLLLDDARRPFVLATGPLVRATRIRLGRDEHVCLLTVHHIASDLVSFRIFWGEVGASYAACRTGRPAALPELPVHFADFAVWQRAW